MLRRRTLSVALTTMLSTGVLVGGLAGGNAIATQPAPPSPTRSLDAAPAAGFPTQSLYAVSGVTSTDYWAVGAQTPGGSQYRHIVQRWNGTHWVAVHTPTAPSSYSDDLLTVKAFGDANVWAVGRYWFRNGAQHVYAEHLAGHAWHLVTIPVPPSRQAEIDDLQATSPDDMWADGWFRNASGLHPLVEHHDATGWHLVPGAGRLEPVHDGQLYGIDEVATNDVWVVGNGLKGFRSKPIIEHYDGSQWTVATVPLPPGETEARLSDLSASGPDDIWAVGITRLDTPTTLVEHYDGTEWSVVGARSKGFDPFLYNVFAVSPTDIWAVGTSGVRALIEHSTGGRFSIVPVDTRAAYVAGIDFTSPTNGMTVGLGPRVQHRAGPAHLLWNGTHWADTGN